MILSDIKFGTSGWRGIIAEDFNFANLKRATLGVAKYLLSKKVKKGVVVGYDSRFMSDIFAKEAVLILASQGIHSFLTSRDIPTPVISAFIIQNELDGGINITASHNPYQYNGFKFSPAWGGPALPEDTKAIEALIAEIKEEPKSGFESIKEVEAKGLCETVDPMDQYFDLLSKNVDLMGVQNSGIKIFYDAIFGTGRDYLDLYLKKNRIEVEAINNYLDPYFNGKGPEPSSENLSNLKGMVKKAGGLAIGVSTDGDADRFGIIGSDGEFIEPNKIIALLADYLARTRKYPKGIGVARSVATSSLIDMVAEKYGFKVYENPVGFKYIGKLISENKILIGGEESAGMSVMNHVPEKDGILACLLMIEAVGKTKSTTMELFEDFYKRIGRLETRRENYHVSREVKEMLPVKLASIGKNFLGMSIDKIDRMDGVKIKFRNRSWVLFRESGTEPLVRVYGEARSEDELSEIMSKAKEFLESLIS